MAEEIAGTFVEVLVAPSFSKDALVILEKKENMRVLAIPPKSESDEIRSIDGGILVQRTPPYQEHWEVITDRDPTPDEMCAIQLAWKVCKHTKSNTIIFADQKRTLGIGAGQMSRVDSAKIAIQKACASLKGSAVASDAFLPFPDTLEVAAAGRSNCTCAAGGIYHGTTKSSMLQTVYTWQWFLREYGTSGTKPVLFFFHFGSILAINLYSAK